MCARRGCRVLRVMMVDVCSVQMLCFEGHGGSSVLGRYPLF